MPDFKPSKRSILLEALVKLLLPVVFACRHRDLKLMVAPETWQTLNELQDSPVLICPNHPRHEDGEILFWLSTISPQRFEILAARELFERYFGLNGLILQRLGCYSIKRGAHDLEAMRFTERLLTSSPAKVVVFPEGEISYNSDIVNPLEPGAIYMGMEACLQFQHQQAQAHLFILPLAISYHYQSDVSAACQTTVARLEQHFGLLQGEINLRRRTRRIAEDLIAQLEEQINIKECKEFDRRVCKVVDANIEACAKQLHCELPDESTIRQIHYLQARILEMKRHASGKERKRLTQLEVETLEWIRLHSLSESRFSRQATPESFAEALSILERLVTGKEQSKGPQLAILSACTPIDLVRYVDDYQQNQNGTVQLISKMLWSRLQERVARLRSG
jgi:hypothetical protein